MTPPDAPRASRRRRKIVARCRSIADLRAAARRRLPRSVFDFVDGGAEDERTLTDNAAAFKLLRFQPKMLVDVTTVDMRTTLLDGPSALPVIVAPYGACGFSWPRGDHAGAEVAEAAGIAYAMSSTASVALEDIAARHQGRRWFQCYIFRRREITAELIARAEKAGFETLVITVDLPVGGNRERDYRNDFSVPFRYTPRNVTDFALHPEWSITTLRNGMPTLANLAAFGNVNDVNATASSVGRNYDPSFNWDDLAAIRDRWRGKLVVKGIARGEDARRLVALGADAIAVSNHGGRQLDGALPTLFCLPEIRDAVGRAAEVYLDGGIRRGTDIVKALALGADAVMLGRSLLYGIAAGGAVGARRALDILTQELGRTMQLLGAPRLADIGPHLIARSDLLAHLDPSIARTLLPEADASPAVARPEHHYEKDPVS
ncbi:alpha-hydroxy acid oxidase [Acuticoccus mangrovi]|uniref:Alpha-hydroxy-acid oxidizing protein n=1 Tax=Acuticoccus mangrovi TaxID=2796142 RepID=A0A934IL05_9HYPH|nr:alpha-hydroxy acid oxidase [Acuticoccus mangrovi]MBJ3776911.1 alpha-hydroxy-acid oxidizing protein [Acuticoccus mangrovi]